MKSRQCHLSFLLTVLLFMGSAAVVYGQSTDNKNIIVKVSDQPLHSGRINPMIYGGFIELLDDLVPGMWAEMINDRNFEGVVKASNWCYYLGVPNFCDREWNVSSTWSYDKTDPFNGTQSAKLTVPQGGEAILSQSGSRGYDRHYGVE